MTNRRPAIFPLACGLAVLGGFLVLVGFAVFTPPRPGLPGLSSYPSAFIGDPVLLPVVAAVLALGVRALVPARSDRWWAAAGALVGLAGGIGTQVLWLTDDHIRPNWTIPRPHHFNTAGMWHAVYLSATSALLSALSIVLLVRLRRSPSSDRRRVLGSPLAAALWIALLGYVALLVHDSGTATFASRTTLVAISTGTLVPVLLTGLAAGRDTVAMYRPAALGVLAGAAVSVAAQGFLGGQGMEFGMGTAVAVTVPAAMAAFLLSRATPIDRDSWLWAAVSAATCALLLYALWVLAFRAHADGRLDHLALVAAAQIVAVPVCFGLGTRWRDFGSAIGTTAALAALVWVAGPLVWGAERITVGHHDFVVGVVLAVTVSLVLFPAVTRRYDERIIVEGKLSRTGTLSASHRQATAAALALLLLALVAVLLGLLSQTLRVLAGADYHDGHGWPYPQLLILGLSAAVLAAAGAAVTRLRSRMGRLLAALLFLPWCAVLMGTASPDLLRQSPILSIVLVLTSALCAWWTGHSLLDNVFLLRLRRVDAVGWPVVVLGALATGLSAYWAASTALVGPGHPWATLPSLLGALGVLVLQALLTTVLGRAAAPPARTVTLYGLAQNLAQDSLVIAVLHTFAVVLPVVFLVHVAPRVGTTGLLTTLALCLPLLTFINSAYRWTAKNNTTHVLREIEGKASDKAAVLALVEAERRADRRLRVQWTAARRGLPNPPMDRFLRVLSVHAHTQNLIGTLLLVPLIVGVLALLQERSSGINVPSRD